MEGPEKQDKTFLSILVQMQATLTRLEKEVERLTNLEERIRKLEVEVAKNSIRLALVYGSMGVLGGAIVSGLVALIGRTGG